MAFQFPVNVWNVLSGSEFRLIEQLSFLRPDRGWVYVGRDWLAKRLALSRDQISRITSHLASLGVLEKFQRRFRRKDGRWDTRPCCYRLVPWILWKLRGLTKRLSYKSTGLRKFASSTSDRKRITPQEDFLLFSQENERQERPETLAKIPIIGDIIRAWTERGRSSR